MDHWLEQIRHLEVQTAELKRINPVQFESLEIKLLTKYVDDVFTAAHVLKPGLRWEGNTKTLVWDPETEKVDVENNEPQDQRTMKLIADISSQILECLNFTWDSLTRNSSQKIPVLDTQLWIKEESREKGIPLEI